MSVGEHNPSRRALLGAAVALPLIGNFRPCERSEAIQSAPGSPRRSAPRNDVERWERALAVFEAAEAAVRECERRAAGAPWAQQDALEEEYGDRLDVLYAALRRLLGAPAPDLAALAAKIELVIDHEVATLSGGEACLLALRRDALRLAAVNRDSHE